MNKGGRKAQKSRFSLSNPREARGANSSEKPNHAEIHLSQWGCNEDEVKANIVEAGRSRN